MFDLFSGCLPQQFSAIAHPWCTCAGSTSMAVGELVSMTQKKEMERLEGFEEDAEEASAWTVALTSWARPHPHCSVP